MSFFAKTLEFINDSGQPAGGSTIRDYGYAFWDLTRLTGANGAAISNGNAGLVDYSGNGHTATIVGTPVVRDITVNSETIKTLHDSSTNCIDTGLTGAGIFDTSFDIFMVVQMQDGIPVATQNILGGIKPTNIGINVYVDTSGRWGLSFGTTSGVFNWRTTAAVFANGVNETAIVRIRVNFASVVAIHKNGVSLAGGFVSGTISSPVLSEVNTDFTTNIYIGSLNNNGTATTNADINSILKVVFLPLQGLSPSLYVNEYLLDFTWANWETKEIHITTGNAATLRANFIADIYNGGGLPTISPSVTNGFTGAIHICNTSNITGASSWDRLTFTTLDVDGFTWTGICYRGFATTPNGDLVIVNNGHGSDVAAAYESLMSQLLALGFDVLYTAMPDVGQNVQNNPTVPDSQSSVSHQAILSGGLDRVGYNPLGLFFFEKFSAVEYLNASYTNIAVTGNSGGGWGSCIMGALDERINMTISNRGVELRSFKVQEVNGDYEQGGFPAYMWTPAIAGTTLSGTRLFATYTAVTYYDLLALCATSGRSVTRLTHYEDSCCFKGSYGWVWMDSMKSICGALGGEFHMIIDFNTARANHQFSTYDIANVIYALGNL